MKQQISREVRRVYEQRRMYAEEARDRLVAGVYGRHPTLVRIDRELTAAGADLLLETIEPGRPRRAAASMARLQAERDAYLREHGIDRSFDQPRYTCPLCRDSGQVRGERCSCYQTVVVPLLTEEANLSALRNMTFASFEASLFSDQANPALYQSDLSPRQQIMGLKKVSERFVAHITDPDTRDMLFIGKPGTGKTFLMACIAHALLQKGFSVLYVTAPQLFDCLQEHRILLSSFHPDPIRLEYCTTMKDSVMNCNLLLIDDLGTESGSAARYGDLLSVIDGRRSNDRKMIISSNADPVSLRDQYDERLLSRLVGGFAVYRFFGEDIRLELNRRRRS
ncbi:MAG: ATP-binding protein [Ruminococcaceae bacterium]|nr:ATP-binding protein [Oscillospiraceae bacterium]